MYILAISTPDLSDKDHLSLIILSSQLLIHRYIQIYLWSSLQLTLNHLFKKILMFFFYTYKLITLIWINRRGVSKIFFLSKVVDSILGVVEISRPKVWGITHKRYLIVTKEKLVLASASYASHESFSHQGQKNTILNFIMGIFRGGICPT